MNVESLVKAVSASFALLLAVGFVLPAQPPLIGGHPDSGRKFDEYRYLPFKEEQQRLSNLAAQLRSETSAGSKGYVYVFGARGRPANEARARACRAKHYLIYAGGIDSKRVIAAAITRGPESSKVELWIWPREAPDHLIHDGSVLYISDEEAKACNGRARRKR